MLLIDKLRLQQDLTNLLLSVQLSPFAPLSGGASSVLTRCISYGIHFTGSGYLLRTGAWSYPVLRLKRLGLSKTFRRLVVTLTRRYGVSLIHLDASAECLPDLPTFDW